MTELVGGYLRHRDRMIQMSVYNDLRDTLIACRWLAGTTSGPVSSPYAGPGSEPAIVTTTAAQVLPLTQGHAITLIDYFPEAEGGEQKSFSAALNTFALDNGTQQEAVPLELGSTSIEQPYVFTMAFFAISDAVAASVFNDLRDRYLGRLVRNETIILWDYNTDTAISRMEVDSFRYTQNTDAVTPAEVHLYFGELIITDYVE